MIVARDEDGVAAWVSVEVFRLSGRSGQSEVDFAGGASPFIAQRLSPTGAFAMRQSRKKCHPQNRFLAFLTTSRLFVKSQRYFRDVH